MIRFDFLSFFPFWGWLVGVNNAHVVMFYRFILIVLILQLLISNLLFNICRCAM